VVTVELVDNGGNGQDTMSAIGGRRAATDCSLINNAGLTEPLTNGRATVFDALSAPTSKEQFKHCGFALFGFVRALSRTLAVATPIRVCSLRISAVSRSS
jgi:hypothetical protein